MGCARGGHGLCQRGARAVPEGGTGCCPWPLGLSRCGGCSLNSGHRMLPPWGLAGLVGPVASLKVAHCDYQIGHREGYDVMGARKGGWGAGLE